MKFSKKEIFEIIDSDGELIGRKKIPTNGSDLESQANNTTDYNSRIGTQPYRYDMLGRFGFTLMPFMEGKEDNIEQKNLFNDVAKFLYEKYVENLKFYYKNPNKLKSDYRKLYNIKYESLPDDLKEIQYNNAKNLMKIVNEHFEKAIDSMQNVDESSIIEDIIFEDNFEDELSKKIEGNDVLDKKIKKIADLINRLDIENREKLIKLLERK